MATDMAGKRQRKPNFSENEINIMAQEINKRNKVLFGKPTPFNTPIKKVRAWEEVAFAVNAVASQSRTVTEVKNKWKQEKARIKSKQANIIREKKKTGGGPAVLDTITAYENQVLSMIGSESISGINNSADIGLPLAPNQNQDPIPIIIEPFSIPLDEIPIEIPDILPPPPNFAVDISETNVSVGTQTDFQQKKEQTIFEQNEKLLQQGEELNKNVATIASHLGDIKHYLCVIAENITNKE